MPTPRAQINITAKDKTQAAIKSVRAGLAGLSRQVLSTRGLVAGLATTAGFGLLIRSSFQANDALAKTADKLGITTEALAGLQHAAALTGAEQETLTKALTKQQKAIFDADRGVLTYKQHFDALGLSTEELKKQSPDQQFATIADALNKVENQTQKTAIAYDIFGGRGTALINTLALGKEGLAAAAKEAKDLGVSISRVDAAKIEAANDQMHRVQQAVRGVATRITVQLAPYISAMADKFVQAAKESQGWKDQILGATEAVATGIAYVGNVIRGLQFAWAAVKLAFAVAAEQIINILDGITAPIRGLVSMLPGVGDEFKASLNVISDVSKAAGDRVAVVKNELDEIAGKGLPADNVKAFFDEVKIKATETAQAVADSKSKILGGQGASTIVPGADKIQGELDRLSVSLLDAETREAESWFRRQEILDTALENRLISETRHKELTEGLEAQHLEKLADIRKQGLTDLERFNAQSWRAQTSQVVGQLASMTQGVAQSSKTMFKINKAAGIANAVISTAQGVAKTLSAYPFPLSVGMAAAQLAAGLAQVSAIKATQFGGGGSAPSLSGQGGGGSTVNTVELPQNNQTQQQPVRNVSITLNGAGYSREDVRSLIEQINQESGDQVRVTAA